jgi:hypothetical protein
MLNPEDVIKQVERISLLTAETNVFICHSNLQALQALSLQNHSSNICLYNEAVSLKFLEKHFNGDLFAFRNEITFTKKQLYPLRKLFSLKNKKLNVFLGNKHNYWSTFIINQLVIKNINILDDGLSSYGISQELFWEENVVKKISKRIVKSVFSTIGWQFFHESNNAEISRQCKAYYFFPELVSHSSSVTKIQLDDKFFHHYSQISPVTVDNNIIHIASFEESKRINKEGNKSENISYILHPRVVGKSADVPAEILLYRSEKVSLSASSLILYLAFIGYKGEYVFQDGDEESKKILSFFTTGNEIKSV